MMIEKYLHSFIRGHHPEHAMAQQCRMWFLRNIPAPRMWCVLVMCMAMVSTDRAIAAGQPLNNAMATQAYGVVENWISRAAVSEQTSAINASDACGVAVTLRFSGLTMGYAIAMLDNPQSPLTSSEPTDIMALARTASQAALDDAQANLLKLAANHRGAMPTELAALAPLLQLDIQIARVPQRIIADSLAEVPARITINAQGLALQDEAAHHWAWQFPGQSVAANLSLQAQLNRLLAGLNMNLTAMHDIATPKGPALYRFDVVQIVRIKADDPPVSLVRGQVVLPGGALDLPAVAQWSARWAELLIARQDTDGRFAGTFEPSYSRYDPAQAPASDAALACYALAAYSKTLGPRAGQPAVAAAQLGIERLLADIGATSADTQVMQTIQPNTQDAAMTLLALMELPGNSRYKDQRDRLATWLTAAYSPGQGFRATSNGQSPIATAPVRAAAALALVRMYDQTSQPQYMDTAKQELTLLWADATKRQVDVIMPWAALAEFELARLGQPAPGLLMAQQACDAIWKHQVREASGQSQAPAADLIGGFRTSGPLFDEPTWLSAGPLIALGRAMTVKNFVNDTDRPAWMLNVALGLRYCAQLTMTPQSAYYVRDLKRAVGAVRSSGFDNRQPTAATAYALLAAAEFQEALTMMATNP